MKHMLRLVPIFGLALGAAAVKADPCAFDDVSGEINNNAVSIVSPNDPAASFPGQVFYTLGVADIKIKGSAGSVKLNCTLLGEPTGVPPGSGYHQYDHMIVCDDAQQSEVAFETELQLGVPLSEDEKYDFCKNVIGIEPQPFIEKASVNVSRKSKGLFAGATGFITVKGCVNFVGISAFGPEIEINMGVSAQEGDFCVPTSPE